MSLGPPGKTGADMKREKTGPVFPGGLAYGLSAALALTLGACATKQAGVSPPVVPVEAGTPASVSSALDSGFDHSEGAPVLLSSETSAGQAPGGPVDPTAVSTETARVETPPAPVVLPTPPVPVPADADFILAVADSIASSEEDLLSQTKVFMDGKPIGETHVGPKSEEKRWGMRLEPGNHLFRFEQWVFTPPAVWGPLDPAWQPRERFIRIEEGSRAVLTLRFSEGGRRHTVQFARERP